MNDYDKWTEAQIHADEHTATLYAKDHADDYPPYPIRPVCECGELCDRPWARCPACLGRIYVNAELITKLMRKAVTK